MMIKISSLKFAVVPVVMKRHYLQATCSACTQNMRKSQGWRCEIIDANEPELGGFKEVIFSVDGENVYSKMKFESGVHRVQRVPATETQGRVHTSTVTVAVLPEMEDVDIEVNEKT